MELLGNGQHVRRHVVDANPAAVGGDVPRCTPPHAPVRQHHTAQAHSMQDAAVRDAHSLLRHQGGKLVNKPLRAVAEPSQCRKE